MRRRTYILFLKSIFLTKNNCEIAIIVEIIIYLALDRKETIIPLNNTIGKLFLLMPDELSKIEINIGKVIPRELILIQLKIEKFLCCCK
jgi:hypothetical protein